MDLLLLLYNWGPCGGAWPPAAGESLCEGGSGDANDDGAVNLADIQAVLDDWGAIYSDKKWLREKKGG